jgi:hypothetical protein
MAISFLGRVFTTGERRVARSRPDPGRYLARRSAAKEALVKVLGTGIHYAGSAQSSPTPQLSSLPGLTRQSSLRVVEESLVAGTSVCTGEIPDRCSGRSLTV